MGKLCADKSWICMGKLWADKSWICMGKLCADKSWICMGKLCADKSWICMSKACADKSWICVGRLCVRGLGTLLSLYLFSILEFKAMTTVYISGKRMSYAGQGAAWVSLRQVTGHCKGGALHRVVPTVMGNVVAMRDHLSFEEQLQLGVQHGEGIYWA